MIHHTLKEGLFLIKKPKSKHNLQTFKKGELFRKRVIITYEETERYIENRYNISLLLRSLPVLVIDIDNDKALSFAEKKGLPSTLCERTKRGYHLFYKIPGTVEAYGSFTYKNGLELKCAVEGDSNILISPSVVEEPYTIIKDTSQLSYAPLWAIEKVRRDREYTTSSSPSELAISEIRDTVLRIDDTDSYDTYVSVGMALHNITEGSEEGLQIWKEWSSSSYKYREYELQRTWLSFDSYTGQKKKGYGTLKHLARGNE